MTNCKNPPECEHNSTQRAKVDCDNADQTVNDAMRYMGAQQIPQFDTDGREYCHICKDYLFKGHLHKDSPEYNGAKEKAREQGMNFDGMQKHATSPRLNMSPAYMQDCINQLKKSVRELDQDLGISIDRIDTLEKFVSEWKQMPKWDLKPLYDKVEEIDRFECNNRALIDELQKDSLSPIAYTKLLGRIEELESWNNRPAPWALEKDVNLFEIKLHEMQQNINCLFVSLKGVEGRFNMASLRRPIPHKCPVCEGNGKNYNEPNYSLLDNSEEKFTLKRNELPCMPCEGKGIVWG